ncbi:MAG TPA: cupin domain-containing protein, partial [Synergistaceae bacterium]|nr:cupin domain-containing protein [Synergistaceae bacterium]
MIVLNDGGTTLRKENVRGGRGGGLFTYAVDGAVSGSHFKMIARIRLEPGS